MYHTPNSRRRLPVLTAVLGAAALTLTACVADNVESSATSTGSADVTSIDQIEPYDAALAENDELRSMLPDAILDAGTFRVGTQATNGLLNWPMEGGDEIYGANADFWTALGELWGLDHEVMTFSSTADTLAATDSGQIDIAWTSSGDTAAREESYDFVSYLLSSYVIVVPSGNPLGIEDVYGMCGTTYGDIQGSVSTLDQIAALCEAKGLDAPVIEYLPDSSSLDLAIASGQIDTRVSANWNTRYNQLMGQPLEMVPFGSDLEMTLVTGCAFAKASAEQNQIRDAVLAAMTYLYDQGVYEDIMTNWQLADNMLVPALNAGADGTMFG
ncbi:MAG: transporter substrate-binding domain-containing protein [Microbacterium sp.]